MGPEVCWPRFPIIVPRCQKGDCPCPRLYLPQLCAQLAGETLREEEQAAFILPRPRSAPREWESLRPESPVARPTESGASWELGS